MILGVNHLLMLILALNFKIVPEIWSVIPRGFNHLLMSMLGLNFKIVHETLVSDTWGSIIF